MFYAIFTCFAWGVAYYLSSKLSKAGISYAGLSLLYLPLTLFLVGYGVASGGIKSDLKLLQTIDWRMILLYLVASFAGSWCVYMAFKTTSPFIVAVIELGYPIVILAILVARGEGSWTASQLIGTASVMAGIVLVLKESA